MPFYKRDIRGFVFHLRLEVLGPAELVTRRCIICDRREVVSPWQLLSRYPRRERVQDAVKRACRHCGGPIGWNVVTATNDIRDVPADQGGSGPPAPPLVAQP